MGVVGRYRVDGILVGRDIGQRRADVLVLATIRIVQRRPIAEALPNGEVVPQRIFLPFRLDEESIIDEERLALREVGRNGSESGDVQPDPALAFRDRVIISLLKEVPAGVFDSDG